MDLTEEREQVIKAILEMGHIPVGMEMFSAGDEQQWKIIQKQIDDCDYYVLIMAHRFGSMDKKTSYTEKEYDYAIQKGIPTLGFIIESKASWPADKFEEDQIKKAKLEDFKDKVKGKLVGFWFNKDDLYAKVSIALMKQFTSNPQEGWVKATEAISPQITQEISRLSEENSFLRKEIEKLRQQNQDDNLVKINETISILENSKCTLSYFYKHGKDWEKGETITLKIIFRAIAPELIIESSAEDLLYIIALMTKPDNKRELRGEYPIPTNIANIQFSKFQALDLIEPSKLKHSVKDTNNYWTLSSYGKKVYKELIIKKLKTDIEKNTLEEE